MDGDDGPVAAVLVMWRRQAQVRAMFERKECFDEVRQSLLYKRDKARVRSGEEGLRLWGELR